MKKVKTYPLKLFFRIALRYVLVRQAIEDVAMKLSILEPQLSKLLEGGD